MDKKPKVIVLAGGISEEREVSLASGKAITEALKRLEHEVLAIDSSNGQSLLDGQGNYILLNDPDSMSKISLKQSEKLAVTDVLRNIHINQNDLIFLALHGGSGEDGTIQAVFDMGGIKYTGSGHLASALAMNKAFTKKLLRYEGLLTPEWMQIKITSPEDILPFIDKINEVFKFPIIVKPNNSGSTVGLTLVKEYADLKPALVKCSEVSSDIIIEEYITGREITAAILSGEGLPLVEIVPAGELYDYDCKYTKGGSEYICPADISSRATDVINNYALRAYRAIGCSGLIRVDFILDEENQPYFLEVNTLPGMTELSLAPMAAAKAGITFDALIDKICRDALTDE